MQLGKVLAQIDDLAHSYTFLRKIDIEAFDAIIISTISIYDRMTILISYVSGIFWWV